MPNTSTRFRDPQTIREDYRSRLNAQSHELHRMRSIQSIMNGEIVLPVAEIAKMPGDDKPAVANLANQGMAQLSRRIASVDAMHFFPSLDPGNDEEDLAARNRGRVMTSWHHENRMRLHLGKRARQFVAYATAPVVIKPNKKMGIPKWYTVDPLYTFPSDKEFNEPVPQNCIYVLRHNYAWLVANYPESARRINKGMDWDQSDPDFSLMFDVLEYVDENEISLTLLGVEEPDAASSFAPPPETMAITLSAVPNLAGRPLAVVPGSINLDKQLGHFDQIIGMYQAQAALMAISIVAQRRAVWPREWAVSRPNERVKVTVVPDPASGTPGQIEGGTLEAQTLDPSGRALELQDRLEYSQRMTASLPAEWGGMSPSNVRTGRRGAQVMGASVDFTISEAQDVFAASREEENKIAIAIDKAWFNRKKIYVITTRSFSGSVEYRPSTLWKSDKHIVEYPLAGVDLENLPIEGGQRVQMGTMSRMRFMEVDPMIPDAAAEMQRITREGLFQAYFASIQQMASMPEGPWQPIHLARLDEMIAEGKPLYLAIKELQAQIQSEQAQEVPQGAPESMPGLSPPGQGVEQPTPPVDDQSLGHFTNLLSQLGTVQQAGRAR